MSSVLDELRGSLLARLIDVNGLAFVGPAVVIHDLKNYFPSSCEHRFLCYDGETGSWRDVIGRRTVVVCALEDEQLLAESVTRRAALYGVQAPVLRLYADLFVNYMAEMPLLHQVTEPPFHPWLAYAVVGTPRSGTEFLCELLTSTGYAGFPKEHLRSQSQVLMKSSGFNCIAYLRVLMGRRMTPNHVFGTKLVSHFLKDHLVCCPDLAKTLSQFKFVRIRRRDVLGQAISAVVAAKTEVYHIYDEVERERYLKDVLNLTIDDADLDRVSYLLKSFEEQERYLDQFLAQLQVASMQVTYEDIIDAPIVHVNAILSFLKVGVQLNQVAIRVKPTRSALTEMIRLCYLDSRRGGNEVSFD